jgi:hypothetical protein
VNRFSREHARDVAQRFTDSWRAEAWSLFGDKVRDALIDSAILDELRIADNADSALTFTATDVVNFRKDVKHELESGVRPKHSRRCLVSYRVHE